MTKKREFGSVRRLPSGKWQARYSDSEGARYNAPDTFVTKADAHRYLARLEVGISKGEHRPNEHGNITLNEYAEKWLARPGKKPSSIVRDRQAIAAFRPILGEMPIGEITPIMVQSAVDSRSREVSASTLIRDFATLKAVLFCAADQELIQRSPARRIALPRIKQKKAVTLMPSELVRLVEELPTRYRGLVLTAGVLGLRWGEAIALRVKDIDFENRRISVVQVVEELSGHLRIVEDPKTTSSIRTLAAPDFLMEYLDWHLKYVAQAKEGSLSDCDLVFTGPSGGILRRRFGERVFRPAASRAGFEGLTFHGLRHSAISSLVDTGIHPRVMAQRAGHSSTRTTLDLYAHVSDSADREAANSLQSRFDGVDIPTI